MKNVVRHRWHWVTARAMIEHHAELSERERELRAEAIRADGVPREMELRCALCGKYADDLADKGAELRVCLGKPVEAKP